VRHVVKKEVVTFCHLRKVVLRVHVNVPYFVPKVSELFGVVNTDVGH